jgi:CheY-like chemotaxis protein
MLRKILQNRVDNISEAADGLIALNMVKEKLGEEHPLPYDVILMDFIMPNMTGPEATHRLRQIGYNGIIIGVTGNTIQSDVDLFIVHGAYDVLSKPLNMNTFEDTLKSIYIYNIFMIYITYILQ